MVSRHKEGFPQLASGKVQTSHFTAKVVGRGGAGNGGRSVIPEVREACGGGGEPSPMVFGNGSPLLFLGGGMKFTGAASTSLLISSSLLSHQSSIVRHLCTQVYLIGP